MLVDRRFEYILSTVRKQEGRPMTYDTILMRKLIEGVVVGRADSGQVDWQRTGRVGRVKSLAPGHIKPV